MVSDELQQCEGGDDLRGRTVLVTGATSGAGLHAARRLAVRGARVLITGRDVGRLRAARDDVLLAAPGAELRTGLVDFSSLASVRNFAAETLRREPRLDALVNNVGAIGLPDVLTKDGLQITVQVNYFAPFLLTFLLLPLLRASAPSRVVTVSSLALLLGDIDLGRFARVGEYSAFGYYCNAKLAGVLFTAEMAERVAGYGVAVNSMDPGLSKSDFFRNFSPSLVTRLLSAALVAAGRPLDDVAAMSVYLATDSRLNEVTGEHFRDCRPFYSSWTARDAGLRAALWRYSKRLVNISRDEDWELHT